MEECNKIIIEKQGMWQKGLLGKGKLYHISFVIILKFTSNVTHNGIILTQPTNKIVLDTFRRSMFSKRPFFLESGGDSAEIPPIQ